MRSFYQFKMDEGTQHLLLDVRRHIDSLLDTKLANPRQDLSAAVAALVRALNGVLRCTGVVEEQGDSESEEEAEVEEEQEATDYALSVHVGQSAQHSVEDADVVFEEQGDSVSDEEEEVEEEDEASDADEGFDDSGVF